MQIVFNFKGPEIWYDYIPFIVGLLLSLVNKCLIYFSVSSICLPHSLSPFLPFLFCRLSQNFKIFSKTLLSSISYVIKWVRSSMPLKNIFKNVILPGPSVLPVYLVCFLCLKQCAKICHSGAFLTVILEICFHLWCHNLF